MDEAQWWIISIIGPAVLLIILVWLVMRGRSNRTDRRTDEATHELYREEEERRREGTDDL